MSINFKYKPDGETIKTFMKSNDFFRGIRGPVGSGKSVSCCIELFRRALLQKKNEQGIRKSRWAVIRNTNPQLRTTTIKTWLDWFPEDVWGNFAWSVPYTHRIIKNDLDIEIQNLENRLQIIEQISIKLNENNVKIGTLSTSIDTLLELNESLNKEIKEYEELKYWENFLPLREAYYHSEKTFLK